MYLVAIAWIYVVLMMSVAEATSSQGSLLGAVFTFLLYGALPLSIVMYLLRTPDRRKARRRAEQAEMAAGLDAPAAASADPDGGGQPPGDAVAPEREKPG
jgi:hypothetical protein